MSATRILGDVEVPAAGTWLIDPDHAEVAFAGRHLGIGRVRGRFSRISGTVHVASDPTESSVDVTIETASVESGSARRDDHLRSADCFDVANHPIAHFHSTAVVFGGTRGTITGDLTIKGITRPVVLDVEYLGYVRDPWGNDRAAFSASATINREDWGVTLSMPLDGGSLLVSKHIKLEIDVEVVRA